ncbi:hypothetical protein GE09DRAFT_697358 [Coniochaeta sp. 2T2.1]|nr:hypothetical protein GE09DRAFT_697358 [Coniochaeta sp. 2T2.1]
MTFTFLVHAQCSSVRPAGPNSFYRIACFQYASSSQYQYKDLATTAALKQADSLETLRPRGVNHGLDDRQGGHHEPQTRVAVRRDATYFEPPLVLPGRTNVCLGLPTSPSSHLFPAAPPSFTEPFYKRSTTILTIGQPLQSDLCFLRGLLQFASTSSQLPYVGCLVYLSRDRDFAYFRFTSLSCAFLITDIFTCAGAIHP